MNYTIQEIAEILESGVSSNSLLNNNSFSATEIKHLIIDSRSLSTAFNSAFFAIKGQRNDGHKFIPELYEKGVRCFIVEELPKHSENYEGAFFIKVPDTVKALQQFVADHRKQFSIPVIGITGSNGKTIVKEWLFQLMREDWNIVRNPKSYNSQVGVPLSVWQLVSENELGIFEAGISLPGEMDKLEAVIQPTIGIFTTVGEAHSENFKGRIQKIQEKLKLFTKSETVIFCSDYTDLESNLPPKAGQKLIRWSRKKRDVEYYVSIRKNSAGNSSGISGNSSGTSQGTNLEAVDLKGVSYNIRIPFMDDGSIENAIHCWVLMLQLGYDNQVIQQRMLQLSPVAMRLEMKEGMNNCLIINDTYNSDLGSLMIALDFLNQQKQFTNKTVILSDILQSGKDEEALYKEVAQLLLTKGVTRLVGIGEAVRRQEKLFALPKIFYENTEAFLNQHSNLGFHNEAILIKGARSFGFEKITKVLQQKAHETVMEINLNAVVHNLNYFLSKLKPAVKLMAMVKASSYGSGSYEIANILQFHRVDYIAVAYADEGVELRKAGITLPIMVMNPEEQGYDAMIQYGLEPEIFSVRIFHLFLEAIRRAGAIGPNSPVTLPIPVHIKLDTGMHRLGFAEEELEELILILKSNKNILVRSVFSHLSSADDTLQDYFTREQISRFEKMGKKITTAIGYPVISHVLNSAGISRFPEAQFDMVRLGIGLYGIAWNEMEQKQLEFVNSLRTTISQIKAINVGDSIGYNRKFIAKTSMRIATVPIGYADGLSRRLSNGRGRLTVKGKPAPILGNVCMDMCMIDISSIQNVKEGDEVIVFGPEYPITRFAEDCETIPYEVLTAISGRVKRIYYQE